MCRTFSIVSVFHEVDVCQDKKETGYDLKPFKCYRTKMSPLIIFYWVLVTIPVGSPGTLHSPTNLMAWKSLEGPPSVVAAAGCFFNMST